MRSIHTRPSESSHHVFQTCTNGTFYSPVKLLCSLFLVVMSLAAANANAVSATPRVQQVETYLSHSCALFQTGEVSCWGLGAGLGNGSLDNRTTPVPVAAINDPDSRLTGVRALASGGAAGFTCALLQNSRVACWGANEVGQLGNIETTEISDLGRAVSTTPVLVRDISGSGYLENVTQVVVGINSACALLQNGQVACWGNSESGILGSDEANETFIIGPFSITYSSRPLLVKDTTGSGTLSEVKELSSSIFHACAILRSRQVACWGVNTSGALGAPTDDFRSTTPVIAHPDDQALRQVAQITTHAGATCALSATGTVSCWGDNSLGLLGDGTTTSSEAPVAVKPIGGGDGRLRGVKNLQAGGLSICAELQGKRAACWGSNSGGMLGNGSTEVSSSLPVEPRGVDGIGILSDIREIKPGSGSSTCALQKGNQVLCWGSNQLGQLGNGTTEGGRFPVPVADLR